MAITKSSKVSATSAKRVLRKRAQAEKLIGAVKDALQSVLDEHVEKRSVTRKAQVAASTAYGYAAGAVGRVYNWIASTYEFFVGLAKQFVALCKKLLASCVAGAQSAAKYCYSTGASLVKSTNESAAHMLKRALSFCERNQSDAFAVVVIASVAALAATAPAAALSISKLAMAAGAVVFATPIVRSFIRTAREHAAIGRLAMQSQQALA